MERRISICIPVYNAEKYLRRLLDSILAQTCGDYEVIMTDDGSTDNSYAICREYANKDNRFRLFKQENTGASAARNKCIENAKGEYITFADADDWLECDYVSTILKNMDNDVDLLFFGSRWYKPNGQITEHILQGFIPDYNKTTQENVYNWLMDKERAGIFGSVWDKCYKKKIIKDNNIKFPLGISFLEDTIFNVRYIRFANRMNSVGKILYNYDQRSCGGSTTFDAGKRPDDFIRSADEIYKSVNQYTYSKLKGFYILHSLTFKCMSANQIKFMFTHPQYIYGLVNHLKPEDADSVRDVAADYFKVKPYIPLQVNLNWLLDMAENPSHKKHILLNFYINKIKSMLCKCNLSFSSGNYIA